MSRTGQAVTARAVTARAAVAQAVAAWAVMLVAILAMAGTVAAHLGLLPHGAWGADEYGTFAHFRDKGFSFLWFRFWSWSPRPLSEIAIAAYAWVVIESGRPLIVPVLAVYWTAFLASALPAMRHLGPGQMPCRALGALSVLAFLVLGRHMFPLYYWPFGIVAYLPVVSAALFVLFTLANGNATAKPGGTATAIVLTGAAWSSEAGALFAALYIGLLAAHAIATRTPLPAWRSLAVPLLAALPVVWVVMTNNRADLDMPEGADPALYHNLVPSLRAAASGLLQEFLVFDNGPFSWRNAVKGLLLKAAFFAGIHALWADAAPAARAGRRWLPVFALALAATCYAMLAGSYRQFGGPCCDQHAQVRENLAFVAVAALAMWLPSRFVVAPRWRNILAPAILTAALVFAIKPRFGDLVQDYRHYGEPARLRAMSWSSAASPGPEMTLYFPVPDEVFKVYMPSGPLRANENWWAANILAFFGKEKVTVRIATRHGE